MLKHVVRRIVRPCGAVFLLLLGLFHRSSSITALFFPADMDHKLVGSSTGKEVLYVSLVSCFRSRPALFFSVWFCRPLCCALLVTVKDAFCRREKSIQECRNARVVDKKTNGKKATTDERSCVRIAQSAAMFVSSSSCSFPPCFETLKIVNK